MRRQGAISGGDGHGCGVGSFPPAGLESILNPPYIQGHTCCTWAGGTFSPVMLLCQFLVLAGNRFWFYILLYLEYNSVVMLCQFFGSGGKQFLTLRTYLVYNAVVRLCQFFGCSGGKQFSKGEHVSTKKSYWVILL